jgi:hypothetical protein
LEKLDTLGDYKMLNKPILLLFTTFLLFYGLAANAVQQGDIYVDIYNASRACNGTTLFADLHDSNNPRLIEVDMLGNIVWEYIIPDSLKQHQNPGMDVELLPNGNILFVLPGYGVHEIDRSGTLIWSLLDDKISHDADRIPNGNTIYVYGDDDTVNDDHVKEVNPAGQIVWSWSAKDTYNVPPYDTIDRQGWVHTNAVTRMQNGNTLVNLRNFNLSAEVDPTGSVVWSFNWGSLYSSSSTIGFDPHEPEVQPNGNVLICLQWDTPYQIVEINKSTGQPVWQYHRDYLRTSRDSDRLPNGNTLIVGVLSDTEDSVIFEVTPAGEIVWQLKVKDVPATGKPGWFYKAQRICDWAAIEDNINWILYE